MEPHYNSSRMMRIVFQNVVLRLFLLSEGECMGITEISFGGNQDYYYASTLGGADVSVGNGTDVSVGTGEDVSVDSGARVSFSGGAGADKRNGYETPAAEVIFTTGLQQQVRDLSFSAKTVVMNSKPSETTEKMSTMMKQCITLHNKICSNTLSKGQKTYIQAEINRIKQSISGFEVAL